MKNLKINLTQTLFLPFVLLSALVLNSCSTYKHSSRISNIAEQNIVVKNKIAVDLSIDLGKTCKGRSGSHKTVKDAKDEAYYDAIQSNSIHVLVDPIYSVTTTKTIFGERSTADVAGFAGYYNNSRSLKAITDALALEKIEKDKQEIQTSIKNYKTLVSIGNMSSIKEVENYRLDENCKPCPIYKTEDKSKSTDEFFKFLSIIK
jgi:hypothetical protein